MGGGSERVWLFGLERQSNILQMNKSFSNGKGVSKWLSISSVIETVSKGPKMKQRKFLSKMLGKVSASNGNFRGAVKSVFEAFLRTTLGKAYIRNSLDKGGFALKQED